jgi:branched-chain amino acid aminotransferase
VNEKDLKLEDVYSADEAFFTGTAAEVSEICSVDDKNIGKICPGPITAKLKGIFMEIVKGKNRKYDSWLTYC